MSVDRASVAPVASGGDGTERALTERLREHADVIEGYRTLIAVRHAASLLCEAADALVAAEATAERRGVALAAYETAVQAALAAAPNHWQRYRNPLELPNAIREARAIGRTVLAGGEEAAPHDADTCADPACPDHGDDPWTAIPEGSEV